SGFRSWLEEATDFYSGWARFVDDHTIAVGEEQFRGETIIIHTGARARPPQLPGIDTVPWLDNRGLLDLQELPKHLLIVGGSYIGMEFGQAFRRFGSEVSIFEKGERIIFREDPEFSTSAQSILEQEGVSFHLNSTSTKVEKSQAGVKLTYEQEGQVKEATGSHILFAVGRLPNSDTLNLESAGVEVSERGHIQVDEYCRTSRPHIYAVGDVNGKGAFTHTSVHDGQVFLEHFFRRGSRRISDRILTYSMYMDPPLARVGMSASQAEREGRDYLVGSMPMSSVSRAKEKAETNGLMKVVVEKDTKQILGATLFGVGGDEIIGMLALAMQAKLPYSTLQETVIPHPTVGELVPWLFADLK
ncbi:MAG: FAD-dependent oxidoreductase, partial [Spirochaetia bacterium]|nr:FAD-dependent oxidoreductase [Spirochaetia bacterium]